MDLPKNITQIGEPNANCKIYVEDYVISYIKQLNRYAGDKPIAVGMYGIRKEEAGITYLFFYGACKLNFLQRESRHLSQAVQQEAEQQRRKYFSQYKFLGYRLLNGDMVEGFHVCEQNICRYIAGYAQFYEKNDSMLAFMLEDRKEEAKPEEFNQEKYDEVKKRQEERRLQSEGQGGQAPRRRRVPKPVEVDGAKRLRNMKYAAASVFVLLCVAGFATITDEESRDDLQRAAMQMLEGMDTGQLEAANNNLPDTLVAEEKLAVAVQQENIAAQGNIGDRDTGAVSAATNNVTSAPTAVPTPIVTPAPTPEATPTPEVKPTPEAMLTPEPTAEPVSYTVKRGDTLIGICIATYGSDERVAEICNFNGITDPDDIKAGQKILLP